jgi:hypothetical protein
MTIREFTLTLPPPVAGAVTPAALHRSGHVPPGISIERVENLQPEHPSDGPESKVEVTVILSGDHLFGKDCISDAEIVDALSRGAVIAAREAQSLKGTRTPIYILNEGEWRVFLGSHESLSSYCLGDLMPGLVASAEERAVDHLHSHPDGSRIISVEQPTEARWDELRELVEEVRVAGPEQRGSSAGLLARARGLLKRN